jgi:homocysteine S-methyltransferase
VKIPLQKRLREQVLLADGAMATYLYQQGVPVQICFEELNVDQPSIIEEVHRTYIQAGSQVIETNTYGANRERLTRYGLERKVSSINRQGARIARQVAGEEVYVLGAIGSILAGRLIDYDVEEYRGWYEEQATALLEGGVDGIILETFLDLEELQIAVQAVRSLTELPLFAQFSLLENGRTRDAYPLSEAFAVLSDQVDGVGFNCRLGPVEILRNLEQCHIPEGLWLSIFPNASRLGLVEGELRYKSHPEYFAQVTELLLQQGTNLIGGCCGTTPEHIARMRPIVTQVRPIKRTNPSLNQEPPRRETIVIPTRRRPTVVEKVKQQQTIICEFDTPKGLEIDTFLHGAQKLHQAGADAITMADNALATTRVSNMALGSILKTQFDIEPLLHIACRDRNLLGQQSHLMGLHALGIDQILVITGDPTRIGDLPGASSVYDLTSFELIRMVKQLNQGLSFSGKPLQQKANFVVGCAFNPHVRQIERAVRRLEKKIEAGADFVMTQPIYDAQGIEQLYQATKHLDIPIFVGIMPITSYRNALFLHNEVPGIKIAPDVIELMERTPDPVEARRLGVQICQDLLEVASEYFRGIYLITPFDYWSMSEELIRYLKAKEPLESFS